MSPRAPFPIFKWGLDSDLVENEDDDPNLFVTAVTEVIAKELSRMLETNGHEVSPPFRDDEHLGCHTDVEVDTVSYSLFVMWTGIGDDSENYFVIQPDKMRGVFASLFGKPTPDAELIHVAEALEQALLGLSQVSSLVWLTSDEFHACYCEGKPLPDVGE